ncbi:hypothetical protein BGW42_003844 [Actinomortierella wolfii]|nr:hypothetical protein BGW42_003844 [Actinomortierella wolfii]
MAASGSAKSMTFGPNHAAKYGNVHHASGACSRKDDASSLLPHLTEELYLFYHIDTSFMQQRLKAWQPILTAKSVLPTFFIIALLFSPLGSLLVWRNNQASLPVIEFSFEYTGCGSAATETLVPDSSFSHGEYNRPRYVSTKANVTLTSAVDPSKQISYEVDRCTVTFDLPQDMGPPVMLYYKLTNFYQNHRRYQKSLDYKQLAGEASSAADIASRKDTISLSVTSTSDATAMYTFSDKGIAWSSDKDRFQKTGYDLATTQVYPPSNWAPRFAPDGGPYTPDFPPPDIHTDEHFHVWMRTAGWPTFLKAYGRNDADTLKAGTYRMEIDSVYPIEKYGGKKYIVLSTVNAFGGRNPSMGYLYVFTGVVCAVLGIVFTGLHFVRPRIIGDHSKISFGNEPQGGVRGANSNRHEEGGNRIGSRYEDY